MSKFIQLNRIFYCIILSFIYSVNNSVAQAPAKPLKITDFVVFQGKPALPLPAGKTLTTPTPGFGVQFGPTNIVKSGRTGSYSSVKTTSPTSFNGSIHSGGTISLYNSNTIVGSIFAGIPNSPAAVIPGTNLTVQIGSSVNLNTAGNIDANGNIKISGGSVAGYIKHPNTATLTFVKNFPRDLKGTPTLPDLPAMPKITRFEAGTKEILASAKIGPDHYGKVKLSGGQKITLLGPGSFYFESIKTIDKNIFEFDFQNKDGNIKIYVAGDVDLAKSVTTFINAPAGINNRDSAASRIFCEVQGNGSTNTIKTAAFTTLNDASPGSSWLGSLWVPFAGINIGSGNGNSNITGALWSGTQVNLQTNVTLIHSAFVEIDQVTKEDLVIIPNYIPPENGKSIEIIGPELISLCDNYGNSNNLLDPLKDIYRIQDETVWIEVICKENNYSEVLSRLLDYGLTNLIDNGTSTLFINGRIPINRLCDLNNDVNLKRLINSCRPLYPPIRNTGNALSGGDSAINARLVRSGYGLVGAGVKIGVLSDSYNNLGKAGQDVATGDLPGANNPDNNLTDVEVVEEFPKELYGDGLDEGRAMLQIVHDVAPKAELLFKTGFLSETHFALGIKKLADKGCKVITDDITYITSPFFKDGFAAKAVNAAKEQGVSYFSSAGNFGNNAYGATFVPAPAPPGVVGFAHDYGNGDRFQSVTLIGGQSYTVVLQWEDLFYSLDQQTGATSDLDIYLTNSDGTVRFGMNRYNMGAEAMELLSFRVKEGIESTTSNIMVVRAGGTTPVRFKYIIFRGDITMEYLSNRSTIVGQANSLGAMTVGAARYTTGLSETFTSIGGTTINTVDRNKPDFSASDGVNTTVLLGASKNLEEDIYPNFFGTSAAAPHAAGVAALLIEGKKKFYLNTPQEILSPDPLRSLLKTTATDMGTPGDDPVSGSGLIDAYRAIKTFAAPKPILDKILVPAILPIIGQPYTFTLEGGFFLSTSQVFVRGQLVTVNSWTETQIVATIPVYTGGNAPVYVYNPPLSITNGLDGGKSATLNLLDIPKKQIVITADNQSKRFGEIIPELTATITVDGALLSGTTLTPAILKLEPLVIETDALTTSNVGFYNIFVSRPPLTPQEELLLNELYEFTFIRGTLAVTRMPLKITPKNKEITYGDKLQGFEYIYQYDGAKIDPLEIPAYENLISTEHLANMETDAYALIDADVSPAELLNMAAMASARTISNARFITNFRTISNSFETSKVIDLAYQSLINYNEDPNDSDIELIGAGPTQSNYRTITNARMISNGVTVNARTISNFKTISNTISNTVGDQSNTNVIVILDEDDVDPDVTTESGIKTINLVTGITPGDHFIVPAAYLAENFTVTYGLANLKVKPAILKVTAKDITILQGDPVPTVFEYTVADLYNGDVVTTEPTFTIGGPDFTTNPAYSGSNAGTFDIIPSNIGVSCSTCYILDYVNGVLFVEPMGTGVKSVKPSLSCVEPLTGDPSGFTYVANFEWKNENPVNIIVKEGPNNFLTGTSFEQGKLPEFFSKNSTGRFQVKFNGDRLIWTLRSYEQFQKTSVGSIASSTSERCKLPTVTSAAARKMPVQPFGNEQTGITPNPTTGRFVVATDNGVMSDRDLLISDVTGKKFTARKINRLSPQSLQIDLPNSITSGVYLLRVKVDNSYKIFRIVKL
ncbi:MAG: S8 family serine peptidase [Bacteroidota bacterium]